MNENRVLAFVKSLSVAVLYSSDATITNVTFCEKKQSRLHDRRAVDSRYRKAEEIGLAVI